MAKSLSDSYLARYDGNREKEWAEGVIQFLSLIRYLETQAKFSSSEATKVLMFLSKNTLPLTYGGLQYFCWTISSDECVFLWKLVPVL